MHLLILGAHGQLGRAIHAACDRHHQLTLWGSREADISSPAVEEQIRRLRPDVVINCAAWTNVDAAEKEADSAFAVNALGPMYIARACDAIGATMVQFSTNEVFAGTPGRHYYEYDVTAPASTYARSKLAGEVAAARCLQRFYIVRVAWLYGPGGNNFPAKIIAAADRNGALKVVEEEFGNPTYAPDVAKNLFPLLETERYGTYHLVNEGHTSRFGLASAVLQASGRGDIPLSPIKLGEWPRPAPPPPHAVLVNQAAKALSISLRPWEEALDEFAKMYLEERIK